MPSEAIDKVLKELIDKARRLRRQDSISLEEIDDLKDQVAALVVEAGGQLDSSLEDFFKSVGASVVTAQRDLDHQSRKYMASGAPLPTQFRIPKANAKFQFAISKLESKKIGLILYSSRSRQELSQQHEIGFEITAAPLTAEQLGLPPMLQQAGMAIRETIRQHLDGYLVRQNTSLSEEQRLVLNAILEGFNHTLCTELDGMWLVAQTFSVNGRLDLHLLSIPSDIAGSLGDPDIYDKREQRRILLKLLDRTGSLQAEWISTGEIGAA